MFYELSAGTSNKQYRPQSINDLVIGRLDRLVDRLIGRPVGRLGLDVGRVHRGSRVLGRHRRRQDVTGRLVAVIVGDKCHLDGVAVSVSVAPGALLAVAALRLAVAVGALTIARQRHAALRPGDEFLDVIYLLHVV